MQSFFDRRKFVAGLLLSPACPDLMWAQRPNGKLKIAAVELLQLKGHRETESGINGQHQVNPLDVYEELRPPVYADKAPVHRTVPMTQIYLRIRTDAGL